MIIFNQSKGTSLGEAKLADSFLARFRGLMLKKSISESLILKLPPGRGRRSSGIHMFFMRIPLDVLFLDQDKIVVDMATLKPWETYTPNAPAQYVIEMTVGSIEFSKTNIGDKLDFTCESA